MLLDEWLMLVHELRDGNIIFWKFLKTKYRSLVEQNLYQASGSTGYVLQLGR